MKNTWFAPEIMKFYDLEGDGNGLPPVGEYRDYSISKEEPF